MCVREQEQEQERGREMGFLRAIETTLSIERVPPQMTFDYN